MSVLLICILNVFIYGANEAPEYVYAYAAFAYFYSSVRHAITFIYSILARSHINSLFWLPKFRWLQKWKTKTKSKQQQQQYSERYCIIWNLLINSVKICMAESVRREQKIKREREREFHILSLQVCYIFRLLPASFISFVFTLAHE